MVTNNSWNSQNPAQVAKGGTGAATITGLLNGNGTSAITGSSLSVSGTTISSSSDVILTGASGGNIQGNISGGGSFQIIGGAAASTTLIEALNTDNSNTSSDAFIRARTGGSSGGSAYLGVNNSGGNSFSWGLAGTSPTILKESIGTPGGTTLRQITSAGAQTLPLQPAFYAYLTSNATNTTGDATVVSINTGTPYTEVTDRGGNLATTGIFTAPVTGMYYLCAQLQFNGTFTAITQITARVTTTSRTIEQDFNFTAGTWGSATGCAVAGIVPMTAGDTAFVKYSAAGATKVVGLNAGDGGSYFCGYLVC